MIGILIQLLISWVLLWLIEKKSLAVLGFGLTVRRLKFIAAGLFLPMIYYTVLFLVLAYFGSNPYQLNQNYTWVNFIGSCWLLFKSVSFETLIFQGALLYILIIKFGWVKASIISAAAFGIYHWFSWELFGQPSAMAFAFLTTGIMGYLWAVAFNKAKSIYLPFALHFGVDFTFMILFSRDKSFGRQLLTQSYPADPHSPGSLISTFLLFLYFIGFPLLLFFCLKTIRDSNPGDIMPLKSVR